MNSRIKSQGQEANHSGRSLEHDIERQFALRNVRVISHSEGQGIEDMFDEVQLVKGVPFRNIYSGTSRSEFVYYGPKGLAVRIECKWQEMAGSVDEKLPYLFLNAERVPEQNVWIVIGGHGMRTNARQWLERQCRSASARNIRVLSPDNIRAAIKRLVERDDPGHPVHDPRYQPPMRRARTPKAPTVQQPAPLLGQ